MSLPLIINGATFEYPETFDENWGVDATGWAQAVTNGMLQRAGGNFPLLADANFGASFGLLSAYFKTRVANPAFAGLVRLAVTDSVNWRNNANSADLPLAVNGFDQLTFNGAIVSTSAAAVTGIIGTANEVLANGTSGSLQTGNVTLTTPQPIGTSSSPTFGGLTLTGLLSSANITPSAADTSILGSVSKPWLSLTTDEIFLHKPGFGQLDIQPNAAQTSYQIVVPAAQGAAGTVLQNDGSGNLSWSGQDVNANSHKVVNVTNPSSAQDAATKSYVDSNAINQLTGDVIAGPGGGSQAATLSTTGVTAGTYRAADITVDAKGRLTSASSSTVAAYTPTLVGVGTATNVAFFFRRMGDVVDVWGTFKAGTTTAAIFSITVPTPINPAHLSSSFAMVGNFTASNAGSNVDITLFYDGTDIFNVYIDRHAADTGGSLPTKQTASSQIATGDYVGVKFSYPV